MTRMLAQKYRPRSLSEVVGQRHATSVLRRALQGKKLPQQILFSGGSGLGKTTLARCVAAALLCENPKDGDACTVCDSCRDIADPSRVHPDVVEFDAASNGQKEQIKDLASRAMMAPQRGEYRVYIIDEAHGLSLGGGQAFLKLLEEPPAHVIFMLATTDPEKMLRTNRGRCVEFELARPTDEELSSHLMTVASAEGWSLSEDAARSVIDATDPALGLRGLLMTLEKLSDTLSWGGNLDEAEVAALLGLPPTARVAALVAAIDAQERLSALSEVTSLRTVVSDEALRRALTLTLRRRVLTTASPLDIWRYDQAVNTPPGRLHTEILVCRLASPEISPSVASLAAHADEASRRLSELASALKSAPVKEVPQKEQSSSAKTGNVARIPQPAPAKQPASPAKPASEAKPNKLDALIKTLQEDKSAAPALAALRASSPVLVEDRVTLSPPTEALKKRLREQQDVIRAAAAKVGVKLTIKK